MAGKLAGLSEADRLSLSARLVGLLTVEGRSLSPHNVGMLALQNPAVTLVGGFRQWLKAGRCVRKGEHGLMIWVPMTFGAKAEASDVPQPAGVEAKGGVRFLVGTVFDVSQTDAVADAPAAEPETESPDELPPTAQANLVHGRRLAAVPVAAGLFD